MVYFAGSGWLSRMLSASSTQIDQICRNAVAPGVFKTGHVRLPREIQVPSHYQNTGESSVKRLLPTLVAVICLSILPSIKAAPATHPTTAARNTSTLSDAQIEAIIRTKLAKSKIGKDGFRFKVQHGIVTWEGTTNVMQHKGSATRMAKSAGAIQVVNNIQVSASAKAKAGANLKKAVVEQ